MPELALGLLLGVYIGVRAGWPTDATLVLGGLVALLLYLGSCAVWPYRRCWWCQGGTTRRNQPGGTGNYRRKNACRICGGGDYTRIGARLIGRG